jgi:hypothetical protein
VGTRLLARQFTPRPRFLDALADLPTRFLPPGYLGEVETTFTPLRQAATVLYEWAGVVFWAVALAATTWVLHRTSVPAGDAAAARALLIRTGGSSLAWSATWSGNSYWFDARGRAAVAYRVLSGVALTSGEPFGEPDALRPAVTGFAQHCAEHGWIPCFYGVGDVIARACHEIGWQAAQVAEETVVALPGLAFTGRRWQDVRTALNKAARAGMTARFITFAHAPRRLTDQIPQRHRVPHRLRCAAVPGGGRGVAEPVRCAAGPARPRRATRCAATLARPDQPGPRVGLRVPVAAGVQGEVPARVPATAPDLP